MQGIPMDEHYIGHHERNWTLSKLPLEAYYWRFGEYGCVSENNVT